jgi:hypothetical protein
VWDLVRARVKEVAMLRRSDAFGVLGLIMLVSGLWLYLTGSEERLHWMYWLGGPFLWFLGFAVLVAWLVLRWWRPIERDDAAGPGLKPK